jgi:uncharacterized HAD superfamily protein
VRVGLDIDGCMYKWDATARYMLCDVLPNSPYKEVLQQESTSWNWIQGQVAPEHWQWLWTEGVRLGLFRYGHLYKGTIQAVRTLAARGHEVVLITHRPKSAITDTLAWLALLDLPISGLHILTNQEPKSLVEPQCDAYIDDKVENVEDFFLHTQAGLVALRDQPWNQHFKADTGIGGITRVKNWDEFLEAVEQLAFTL